MNARDKAPIDDSNGALSWYWLLGSISIWKTETNGADVSSRELEVAADRQQRLAYEAAAIHAGLRDADAAFARLRSMEMAKADG